MVSTDGLTEAVYHVTQNGPRRQGPTEAAEPQAHGHRRLSCRKAASCPFVLLSTAHSSSREPRSTFTPLQSSALLHRGTRAVLREADCIISTGQHSGGYLDSTVYQEVSSMNLTLLQSRRLDTLLYLVASRCTTRINLATVQHYCIAVYRILTNSQDCFFTCLVSGTFKLVHQTRYNLRWT